MVHEHTANVCNILLIENTYSCFFVLIFCLFVCFYKCGECEELHLEAMLCWSVVLLQQEATTVGDRMEL